jgi:hypothetical protein
MTDITDLLSQRTLKRLSGFEIVDLTSDDVVVIDLGPKYLVEPGDMILDRRPKGHIAVLRPRRGEKTLKI